ncbi:MAG: Dickkopf N-terminal cysteine-rich domain-containing protein [Kofleriaceae bacterium]
MSIKRLSMLCCFALATALAGTGCTLYFGEGDNSYSFCDSSGCYQCDDDGCWCTDGSCGGGGFYCDSDSECAAGCYCSDYGYCEEAGYCVTDADCGPGFLCDEARNSCDPDGGSGACTADYQCGPGYSCSAGACVPTTCDSDDDCAAGCYCDPTQPNTFGGCAESCYCSTDAEAVAGGYGWCDEERSTCMPGTDPDAGTCTGELTCNLGAPTCPAAQVPLIKDGCYTGECVAIESCEAPPACEVLNTEGLCLVRSECTPVYTGTNCTNSGGTSCQAGDAGCTCQNYSFDECRTD